MIQYSKGNTKYYINVSDIKGIVKRIVRAKSMNLMFLRTQYYIITLPMAEADTIDYYFDDCLVQ